jgi:hypothetical protein
VTVPTRAQLHEEVDRQFRDRYPSAPTQLDPDDPEQAELVAAWLELRDEVVNEWTDAIFAQLFPDTGRLDPADSNHAHLIEYWLDLRDQIRDDAPAKYGWDDYQASLTADYAPAEPSDVAPAEETWYAAAGPGGGHADQGGPANVTDLEQDMRAVLLEWQGAAEAGVSLFATTALSERLDDLESGSWENFLVGLLGNTIWAGAAFASGGAAFAISMIGIAVNASPAIPAKTRSALPDVQEMMINYIQTVFTQLNGQLRDKAHELLAETPGATRYGALGQFISTSFKTGMYVIDGTAMPRLDQSAITDAYNALATDQLNIAEAVGSAATLVVYVATYIGYDPIARQPLADGEERRMILYGWKVAGSDDSDKAAASFIRHYGDGVGFSWHRAPVNKTIHHVVYEWWPHRQQISRLGVDTREYDADNGISSEISTSPDGAMPPEVTRKLSMDSDFLLTMDSFNRTPGFGVD